MTGYEILRRRPKQGEDTLLIHVADTGSAATSYTDGEAAEAGNGTSTGSRRCGEGRRADRATT